MSPHKVRNPNDLLSVEEKVFSPQLGLATSAQLRTRGITQAQIHVALAQGRWIRGAPGVYALPNWPADPARRLLAACLVSGGVASHASAAWLWGLLRYEPDPLVVSVHHGQSPTGKVRSPTAGRTTNIFSPLSMVVHRSRDLLDAAISLRRGVPTTNPLRSLVDMAGDVPPALLDEAVDVALATGLVTIEGLKAEATRLKRPGRRAPPTVDVPRAPGLRGRPLPQRPREPCAPPAEQRRDRRTPL